MLLLVPQSGFFALFTSLPNNCCQVDIWEGREQVYAYRLSSGLLVCASGNIVSYGRSEKLIQSVTLSQAEAHDLAIYLRSLWGKVKHPHLEGEVPRLARGSKITDSIKEVWEQRVTIVQDTPARLKLIDVSLPHYLPERVVLSQRGPLF